jgi:aspartyl/glutamyl-tRNA(Asn/Gln) amidotransferase C subunit
MVFLVLVFHFFWNWTGLRAPLLGRRATAMTMATMAMRFRRVMMVSSSLSSSSSIGGTRGGMITTMPVMNATTVRVRDKSLTTTTTLDPEGRWSAHGSTTEGMPTRASWSTTALTAGEGGSTSKGGGDAGVIIDAKELRSVARLANVSTRTGEEGMLKDVDGILRFVKRLDAVDTNGVKPMWTTREAAEEGGEGLRMRFDASAPGERELASLDRGRLMAEAKYANGDRYVAPKGGVSEE